MEKPSAASSGLRLVHRLRRLRCRRQRLASGVAHHHFLADQVAPAAGAACRPSRWPVQLQDDFVRVGRGEEVSLHALEPIARGSRCGKLAICASVRRRRSAVASEAKLRIDLDDVRKLWRVAAAPLRRAGPQERRGATAASAAGEASLAALSARALRTRSCGRTSTLSKRPVRSSRRLISCCKPDAERKHGHQRSHAHGNPSVVSELRRTASRRLRAASSRKVPDFHLSPSWSSCVASSLFFLRHAAVGHRHDAVRVTFGQRALVRNHHHGRRLPPRSRAG